MAAGLAIDGRRISIDRIGNGSDLICLPGGPGFPGAQLGDLGGVSDARSLLRVDWRGAGDSDAPVDGRHGVVDYVADLAVIQAAVWGGRICLFGHSFGGLVAATYAAEYPDRVDRLILDATPLGLGHDRAPADGIRSYFARFDSRAKDYVREIMGGLYEPAGAWFQEHQYNDVDLSTVLPNVICRTLVISGEHDWAVGPEIAAAIAEAAPDAEAAVIADAGHFAWVEQPDKYATKIIDFLSCA